MARVALQSPRRAATLPLRERSKLRHDTGLMEQQHYTELMEAVGRMKSVIETQLAETHDKIAELVDKLEHVTEVLREQTEEMGALYDAIDDYRELVD